MKLTIQRSIPFPRISIDRLIKYLTYIRDEETVSVDDLKSSGIDFGKGKGDLTRFFNKLGIVSVQGNLVSLTEEGKRLVSDIAERGARALHEYLINELPQYRLLIEVIRELGRAREDEILTALNDRLTSESPSAWINKVALRSMIGILQDLGVVTRVNGVVMYVGEGISNPLECLSKVSIPIGDQYLVSIRDLANCLGRGINPLDLSNCGSLITAPNDVLLKYSNADCLVKVLRTY